MIRYLRVLATQSISPSIVYEYITEYYIIRRSVPEPYITEYFSIRRSVPDRPVVGGAFQHHQDIRDLQRRYLLPFTIYHVLIFT